jgi:hypothetical protein
MPLYRTINGLLVSPGGLASQQACCCEECGCSFREGSKVVVTAGGIDIEVDPFYVPPYLGCPGDVHRGSGLFCSQGSTYVSDVPNVPEWYCETKFGSNSEGYVWVGCHNAAAWSVPGCGVPIPENWPNSGLVVVLYEFWWTATVYPECFGPGAGAGRWLYYRMQCDSEGYPATGELFYDSGIIDEYSDESYEYGCFDCTNQPALNRACETLPTPSSVTVVGNPFP